MKLRLIKTCVHCGAEKPPGSLFGKSKYCSYKCASAYREQRRRNLHARPRREFSKKGLTTGTIGAIGELRACSFLLENGYEVFRAVSPAASCDLLVIGLDGKLERVEVRTGVMNQSGKIRFPSLGCVDRADLFCVVVGSQVYLFNARDIRSGSSGTMADAQALAKT